MIKSVSTLIIAILFSTSVCFGQANSGSGSGKGQAAMSAGVSMVMGAGLITGGGFMIASNCPNWKSVTLCILGGVMVAGGMLSVAQGVQQLTTAKGASQSEYQSGYMGADFAGKDFELSLADGRTLDNNKMKEIMSQGRKSLAQAGIKLKDNGDMTFPNGNTANISDLSNGNSAAFASAAGLSAKEMNELKDKMNKAGAQAVAMIGKDVNMAALGGGSRVPASETPVGGSNFDMNSMFGKAKAKSNLNRGVAGLSKMLGGQPIGVAQDDIFKMVSRKYEYKKSESFFIEGDWGQ